MDDLIKQKLGVVLGFLAVLFAAKEGLGDYLPLHYTVFELDLSVHALIKFLNIVLILAAYAYAFLFISNSQLRLIGRLGDILYIVAMAAPILFAMLYGVTVIVNYIVQLSIPEQTISVAIPLITVVLLTPVLLLEIGFLTRLAYWLMWKEMIKNTTQIKTKLLEDLKNAQVVLQENGDINTALQEIYKIENNSIASSRSKTMSSALYRFLSFSMRWIPFFPPALKKLCDEYFTERLPKARELAIKIRELSQLSATDGAITMEQVEVGLTWAVDLVNLTEGF